MDGECGRRHCCSCPCGGRNCCLLRCVASARTRPTQRLLALVRGRHSGCSIRCAAGVLALRRGGARARRLLLLDLQCGGARARRSCCSWPSGAVELEPAGCCSWPSGAVELEPAGCCCWPSGAVELEPAGCCCRTGNLQHEYAGSDSVRLGGPGARLELISLLRYMKLCMYFSKKPYKVFLEFGGFDQSDVLIKKSKARFLKPAFTVVRDRDSKCFLLFIRGAISVKERLTAATGADIPFHHVVAKDGCVSNLVLGYAHCGMATAARWIANQAIPCLSKAVEQFPDHRITIIGHSMGASIAALLTYILRENDKLLSSTCIAFGAAACMTWDLAESGKDFITTIVNRNDVVPSLGRVSTAKLRTEVMASSWVHELREQIQQTRFLGFVNRSVSFMRSHVPFVSDPKSKVVDVDMLQPPTSEAETTSSEDVHCGVKKRSALVCWSCSSARKQTIDPAKHTRDMKKQTDVDVKTEKNDTEAADAELVSISFGELNLHTSDNEDTDKEDIKSPLKRSSEGQVRESLTNKQMEPSSSSPSEDPLQLYPPGRILHMVALPAAEEPNTSEQGSREEVVTLYETPRHLYSKIRLGRSMVGEHYMPKYIRTMELLIEKLAKEDMDSDQLDLL